jgi:anti-anti-sigma factor
MDLVQISHIQGHIPVTVFQLLDRINLGNYDELERIAQEEFNNGMRDLVIDLSKTPSLTSIGVRSLVVIYKMLAKDGKKHLKLAGPIHPIREMLEVAGITQSIEIYDTVEEAAGSLFNPIG